MNIFYIYCHRKKTDGKCFYIGKGKGNRYKTNQSRNQHWYNIVNKHGFEAEILINNKMPSSCYIFTPERKQNTSQIWKQIWEKDNGEIGKKISQTKKGKKMPPNKKGKGLKPIICSTLFGMEFESLSEASELLNLNKGNICEVLKGNLVHIKGFTFRYK